MTPQIPQAEIRGKTIDGVDYLSRADLIEWLLRVANSNPGHAKLVMEIMKAIAGEAE